MHDTRHDIDLGGHVLKTLLYFDIFSYPLNEKEVFKFLKMKLFSEEVLAKCLHDLTESKHIYRFGDLYSLHPDENNVHRRVRGNAEAEKWLKVAMRKAKFIAAFPFVRGVMASGSLSKGYMDDNSDLDFFIVTAPGRLWIARTLLVLYKRIFLLNSHKEFCVNYFVDEKHLEIEEKNLFTATELITLIPLYNPQCYGSLLAANLWVNNFFPNCSFEAPRDSPADTGGILRRFFELILSPVATVLDKLLMSISRRRWTRIYSGRYSAEDFDVAFKTRRYVSKNHPNYFQKNILERYEQKLTEFRSRLPQLTTHE